MSYRHHHLTTPLIVLAMFFMSLLASASLVAADGDVPAPVKPLPTISLPPSCELSNLADLTSQLTGVSIQYNPQKIQGTVRLSSRAKVTPSELWDVFNQALIGEGFTTVLTNILPAYQVVAIGDASGLSIAVSEGEIAKLAYQPGFVTIVRELKNVTAETAIKALATTVANQSVQVRTIGQDDRKLIISSPQAKLREVQAVLALIDRSGLSASVQLFRPQRTGPQNLQSALANVWNAMNKLTNRVRQIEVQIAPDNLQVMLISSAEDAPELLALANELDRSEPVETKTYRPKFFSVDEVGALLEQVLHGDRGEGTAPVVIHDRLTNSIIVKATANQHQRAQALLNALDEAPQSSRRQMRTYQIKHRTSDELARVLMGLIATGVVKNSTSAVSDAKSPPANQLPPGFSEPKNPAHVDTGMLPAPNTGSTIANTAAVDNPVVLTSDSITNSLIAIGDPQSLDHVEALLKQLDRPQPQVDLEVLLVQISGSENLNLGVELTRLIRSGSVSASVSSLFGISNPVTGDSVARVLPATATGFGAVVLNPGDYSAVVQALEGVTNGRSMIVSHIVVNNNAKASLNGIVSEPYTSINSTSAVATAGLGGTSDAGTQISISPQISAADYVTLEYTISQSAFLGSSTVNTNGTVVPPAKRSDNLSSVSSIPDGYIAAIGGLSNRSTAHSESRVPLLGRIPLFGYLFKSQSDSDNQSRFYAFIRPSILRHPSFGDLKRSSAEIAKSIGVEQGKWPVVEPQTFK